MRPSLLARTLLLFAQPVSRFLAWSCRAGGLATKRVNSLSQEGSKIEQKSRPSQELKRRRLWTCQMFVRSDQSFICIQTKYIYT